jgi:Spy/CpxP family protein refolding chaperone
MYPVPSIRKSVKPKTARPKPRKPNTAYPGVACPAGGAATLGFRAARLTLHGIDLHQFDAGLRAGMRRFLTAHGHDPGELTNVKIRDVMKGAHIQHSKVNPFLFFLFTL